MKRCRYMYQSRFDRITTFFVLGPIGIVLMVAVAFLYRYANDITDVQKITVILLFPISLISLFILPMILFESRQYKICETGIIVGGLLRKKRLYLWDQIFGIGVYAFNANAGIRGYSTVICCFLRPQPDYFKEKMLKGYLYAVYRMKSLLVIDFSHTVLDELISTYPGIISDFRNSQIRSSKYNVNK